MCVWEAWTFIILIVSLQFVNNVNKIEHVEHVSAMTRLTKRLHLNDYIHVFRFFTPRYLICMKNHSTFYFTWWKANILCLRSAILQHKHIMCEWYLAYVTADCKNVFFIFLFFYLFKPSVHFNLAVWIYCVLFCALCFWWLAKWKQYCISQSTSVKLHISK